MAPIGSLRLPNDQEAARCAPFAEGRIEGSASVSMVCRARRPLSRIPCLLPPHLHRPLAARGRVSRRNRAAPALLRLSDAKGSSDWKVRRPANERNPALLDPFQEARNPANRTKRRCSALYRARTKRTQSPLHRANRPSRRQPLIKGTMSRRESTCPVALSMAAAKWEGRTPPLRLTREPD